MIHKEFECVIDRCKANPGVLIFDDLMELLSSGVGLGATECFVDEHTWLGAADALLSKDRFRVVVLVGAIVVMVVIDGNHSLFYIEDDSKPTRNALGLKKTACVCLFGGFGGLWGDNLHAFMIDPGFLECV